MWSPKYLKRQKLLENYMGRIRTTYIKRMTRKLLELFPGRFTKEFKKNKEVMKEVSETPSKQLRNKIAGSITRTLKTQED